MKPYFIFIAYNSGGYYNCICHSAKETYKYLIELYQEEEITDIPPSVEDIKAIDDYMDIVLSNGTRVVITEPSPYSIGEIKKINSPTCPPRRVESSTRRGGNDNNAGMTILC